jgi:hypothetical protein
MPCVIFNASFSVVASIWGRLCSLFDAWLTPLHDHQRQETAAWIQQLAASQKLLLPWAPGDLKVAAIMATTQAKCIALLQYTVPGRDPISTYVYKGIRIMVVLSQK